MAWWTYDGAAWKKITNPQITLDGLTFKPIIRGLVYDGAAWKRFWPESEVTLTTITSGLAAPTEIGVAETVSGTVQAVAGTISGGTVTVKQRKVGATTWTTVGTTTAGTGAVASWSASVTPAFCGATEFMATYAGNVTYQPSDSPVYPTTVTVKKPAKPVGGTIANTTAQFTWTAVTGATGYKVYRGTTLRTTLTTELTYTDTGLSPNTDYSWTVVATADSGTCSSVASDALAGHTGQAAVQDSGSMTAAGSNALEVRPFATGSYRPDAAWGYIGEDIGIGYFSDSNRNYTGCIDFGGQTALKNAVIAALGTNGTSRWNNLVVSAARIYLHKVSGVGASAGEPVALYNSTSAANVGGQPNRQGTVKSETSAAANAGKWHDLGTAHWQALKDGTGRSIVTYDNSSANYARFQGKSQGTDRCNLQLDCSWNYALTAPVTPSWTP